MKLQHCINTLVANVRIYRTWKLA